MLQDIRDRATGPIAWFIVALLIVPFALWGVNSYFRGSGGQSNDVAKVGGQTITNIELQRAYNNRYRRLQQALGSHFNPDMIKPRALRKQVLQSLIQRSLLTQYAHNQGYRVTDSAVLGYLRQIPAFQSNGKFSSQTYRRVLERQGMQPAAFEAQIRQALLIQQIRGGLARSTVVTRTEVNHAYQVQHETRSLRYLVYHAGHYRDKVKVTQQEVKEYYRSHRQAFATPRKVKLAYVELNRDKLKPEKAADQSALKVIYEAEKSRFSTPAARRARHILIKVDNNTSNKAAKAKAAMIRKKIEGGADFAKMAKKYSQDAGSSGQGGQLGWIGPDDLSEPFENALFDMQKGAVSKPVRTQYGWHLIKLEAIRPAHTKSFNNPEVQAKLEKQYQHRAVKNRFEKMADTLGQIAFEKPDSLEPVAQKLGLKVEHTGWITRGGQHSGIASRSKVIKAAFSDQVLNQHVNSKPIDLSNDRRAVLRVADQRPARTQPLKQVRARIVKQLRQKQAADRARRAAHKALSAAEGGKNLQALAKGDGHPTYKHPGYVKREQKDMNQALLSEAFEMAPVQKKDKPSYAAVGLANGDVAVVALDDIRYGDPSKASASARKKLRKQLARRQASAELAAYMDSIRKHIKVKIFKANNAGLPTT